MLIIGDSAIGKTNLLLKYCGESFTDNHLSTIGINYNVKAFNIFSKQNYIKRGRL